MEERRHGCPLYKGDSGRRRLAEVVAATSALVKAGALGAPSLLTEGDITMIVEIHLNSEEMQILKAALAFSSSSETAEELATDAFRFMLLNCDVLEPIKEGIIAVRAVKDYQRGQRSE